MTMNLVTMAAGNQLKKTGITKKLAITLPGQVNQQFEVYAVPLDLLYYNDQNGRINTTYKQYQAENDGTLIPERGDSEYNKIFENFVFKSNEKKLEDTLRSIEEKTQQEPGVVLHDGRVIDGNRRFTALRKLQEKTGIAQTFDAIILNIDQSSKLNEKMIKELELDLQLGREERVNYDPIDRIFDVYNTIVATKLMTVDEYKKASGAGNTRGINKDIRFAELILKFIEIVSPGGNPLDKFYLARELKLDGPIEEIGETLAKLKHDKKEAITDAVLVQLALAKSDVIDSKSDDYTEPKIIMRELKNRVLKKPEMLNYYIDAVDENVDVVMDTFEEHPIQTSNDLKVLVNGDEELREASKKIVKSSNSLQYKSAKDSKRTKVLSDLDSMVEDLAEIENSDFEELREDEYFEAKELLQEMSDILFKLKKGFK